MVLVERSIRVIDEIQLALVGQTSDSVEELELGPVKSNPRVGRPAPRAIRPLKIARSVDRKPHPRVELEAGWDQLIQWWQAGWCFPTFLR